MLKLSSLLPSFLSAKTQTPSFDVFQYLSSEQIAPPLNTITDSNIPYLELRRLFFLHEDKMGNCPLRSSWKNGLQETSSMESVSFQEIKGCISSKSGLTDFELMRHHPKSSANVNFHIKAYADRVDDLAEKVLNGTLDCAVHKDQPAKIVKQDWNGDMWLDNDGGSHRSAAVWHIDREQGRERILPSRITTEALSQDFRAQCSTHSIWMFQFLSKPDHDIWTKFKESDVRLSKQNDGFTFGASPDFCLIVKKSDPRHDEIAKIMTPALNLSDWVNRAYAHQAPEYSVPSLQVLHPPHM